MRNGRFIVVDGLTGSGKSTILEEARRWASDASMRLFDLKEWFEEHHAPPRFEDVAEHDAFFTFEPTRGWIGAAIRYEMSRIDGPYSAKEIAHAFALDRHIMYERLILPALNAGKTVIQDRSVTSSLIIQPLLDGTLSVEDVASLPGNAFALKHAPDTLVLTKLDPEIAVERMAARADDSKGIYEQLDLLKKEADAFESEWFHSMMNARGTTINTLNTNLDIQSTRKEAYSLFARIHESYA